MFTAEEIRVANATSRHYGATAMNKDGTLRAVVPKYVESIARKEDKILDYGAGKGAMHTLYLREKGLDCTAYDFGENVTELHDKSALDRQYDIVFASNVLNVCSTTHMLVNTTMEIWQATKAGGIAIVNYPSSPRKCFYTTEQVKDMLECAFDCSTAERVGGTKASPVWAIKKKKLDVDELLDKCIDATKKIFDLHERK